MKDRTTISTIRHWNDFKLKVLAEGILVGLFTGLIVVFYRILLNEVSSLRQNILSFLRSHSVIYTLIWVIVLALSGIIIGILINKYPMIKGSGIPQVKGVLLRQLKMNWLVELIGKFVGGVLSIGLGLSLGREGPSVQLGSQVGLGMSRILKRHNTEEKYLITSGASAGLAAAFNAPLAGVVFALEELHRNFPPVVLICVMGSSLAADFVSKQFFGLSPVFKFQNVTPLPLNKYIYLIGLGILAGAVGGFFNYSLVKVQDIYKKTNKISDKFKPVIPFMLVGILGFILPEMLGGGHELIETLSHQDFLITTLVLFIVVKLLFTIICYGSGAPGGIFLPLLVIGALLGKLYGVVLVKYFGFDSIYMVNFIILSMAACFTAIVRAPITGAILILEMTNSFQHLLALIVVAIVAYVFTDLINIKPIYEVLLERLLHGNDKNKIEGEEESDADKKAILEIPVFIGSTFEHRKIRDIDWPSDCLIIGIHRGNNEIIPRGDTEMLQGDRLIVLTNEDRTIDIKPMLLEMGEKSLC